MVIIINNEEVTEEKKKDAYKNHGLFKIINRITRLIEKLEELEQEIAPKCVEEIRKDTVKEINKTLDMIEEEIQYKK